MSKKYRDGLFRDYYSDKWRLLDLCNALLDTQGNNPEELIINTLDGIFFDELKNDLSCLYKNNFLVLVEHQSTPNENMPLRALLYVAELFKQYIEPFRGKIYQTRQIELPTPRFYLFYNGRKSELARRQMKISTAFKYDSDLELTVNFYNLNAGKNEEFIRRAKSLWEYCFFVNRVERNLSEGMSINEATAEAIHYCINKCVMAEYLIGRRKEVVSMLGFEYDAELARKARDEEAREEGLAQGLAQGRAEKALEMVKNLLLAKTPMKYIVAATGWSEEEILALTKKN